MNSERRAFLCPVTQEHCEDGRCTRALCAQQADETARLEKVNAKRKLRAIQKENDELMAHLLDEPWPPVFRLDPIDPNNPVWAELSTISHAVLTRADSAGKARQVVANKTVVGRTPKEPHAPIPRSPWLDDKLSLCVMQTNEHDIAEGAVVGLDGRELQPGQD
jgi:hypothetical protein